jgi:hypothetical protein
MSLKVYEERLTSGTPAKKLEQYADETRIFQEPVPATDKEFLSSEGELLIAWGTFNPNSPTLFTLLLMRMAGLPGRFLGYAVLGQSLQQRCVLGHITDEDFNPQRLASMVSAVFLHNHFGREDEDGYWLIHEECLPTFFDVAYEDSVFKEAVPKMLASNPVLAAYDFSEEVASLSKYLGKPWDRARYEITDCLASILREKQGKPSTHKHPPAGLTDWLKIMNKEEHKFPEKLAFARAWMESDRSGSLGGVVPYSYSFERLSDFLFRYKYPLLFSKSLSPAEMLLTAGSGSVRRSLFDRIRDALKKLFSA